MMHEDLCKPDWDNYKIHFSSDRRIDEQQFIELSHLRVVKKLHLYQDGEFKQTYKQSPFFQHLKLNKLFISHLTIHCKNFHKTKELIKIFKHAHIMILEIYFEQDTAVPYFSDYDRLSIPFKVCNPAHIILNNVHENDVPKVKWLVTKCDNNLSSIWLCDIHKNVQQLPLPRQIDNLHINHDCHLQFLDTTKVTNLYIHGLTLPQLLEYNTHVKHANNVILITSSAYLVKLRGRVTYDLHITNETYQTHKNQLQSCKTIVKHKSLPSNWAKLYEVQQ